MELDEDAVSRAVEAARKYQAQARRALDDHVFADGRLDAGLCESNQRALHGFSWIATTCEALACVGAWAGRLAQAGRLGEALIPDDIVAEMAGLGVFGICIAPEYGGMGHRNHGFVASAQSSMASLAIRGSMSYVSARSRSFVGTGSLPRQDSTVCRMRRNSSSASPPPTSSA